MPDFHTYWGKAKPPRADGPQCHRLAYHALDVAAVGAVWWDGDPGLRRRVAQLLGVSEPAARAAFLCGLAWHDIGKFAGAFQALSPEAAALVGYEGDLVSVPGQRHDGWGVWLWERKVAREQPRSMAAIIQAFLGHHGKPRDPDSNFSPPPFSSADISAAKAFIEASGDLLGRNEIVAMESARASWLLAGLAAVCDWIGSNVNWFPYELDRVPLDQYWMEKALPRAVAAHRQARVIASVFELDPGALHRILPEGAVLSPLQAHVAQLALPSGPQLHILEDLTGAGKTEAALILSRRLMAAGLGDGIFFALPTQATANAMWARIDTFVRSLRGNGDPPTVVLAHRARSLVVGHSEPYIDEQGDRAGGSDHGPTASRDASAWLWSDTRKAPLADIGVGTVDQAVLSIFPVKFQSVRLAAIARRVLVLDEIHAYDAYVSENIRTLLRFHASLGGSAILLSATLANKQRAAMQEAFVAGLGKTQAVEPAPAFPQASFVHSGGTETAAIEAAARSRREFDVEFICPDNALDTVVRLARSGSCVCWMRNTVNDVIESADALAAAAPEIDATVFHARFAMSDRLEIERRVIARFGKGGTQDGRRGRVVIASQVLEQSIDVDFDEMVTDVAPIDLLLQRSGRHRRFFFPWRNAVVRLFVVAPAFDPEPGPQWLKREFGGTAAVYSDPAIIWRTQAALLDTPHVALPEMARGLIERVYGPDSITPDGLILASDRAEGRSKADRATAVVTALSPGRPYAPEHIWTDEVAVKTRLSEPQVTLRLARVEGDRVSPWFPDADPRVAWQQSELRVARWRVDAEAWPSEIKDRLAAVRAAWRDADDDSTLLIPLVHHEGADWRGRALNSAGGVCRLQYDNRCGLRFLSEEQSA